MADETTAANVPEHTPTSADSLDSQTLATQPTDEDFKRRWELFNEHKRQVWADMQSGSDNYDQSLLTLSSGALALSLAFIKDVVPLKDAHNVWMLFASWFAFAACILSVIASYKLSVKVQESAIEEARKAYFGDDANDSGSDVEQKKYERRKHALDFCNNFSGGSFIIGFLLTILFAIINVEQVVRR
jgi:hypothetical protein